MCARRSQCAHNVHTMTCANVVCTPITHEDTHKRGFYVWQCENNGQSCLLLQHRLVALLRLENLLVPIPDMIVNGGVQFFHQFHETRLPVRSIYTCRVRVCNDCGVCYKVNVMYANTCQITAYVCAHIQQYNMYVSVRVCE